jgi:S-adenosylmethionine hydrolase
MAIITLTTDFGWRDGYVGAMKGVIARGAYGAMIVDIAHDVPSGDIAHAAWVVATSTREFPDDTIHVVVVDPGVGGARRGVVVRAHRSFYVGPDNGVFAYLKPKWAHEMSVPDDASATFHGRDVFAPVAAHIAARLALQRSPELGPEVELVRALPWGARPANEGRIVHVDHFGNLISDLPAAEAGDAIAIAGHTLPIVRTFSSVAPGQLLAYVGSARTIEVAVRDGSAERMLNVERGLRVLPVASPSGPFR